MKDPEIFALLEAEHQRQLRGIELIASENFVSDEVMKAMGYGTPTSMQKDTPAIATMAAAKLSTKQRPSPSNVPKGSSVQSM